MNQSGFQGVVHGQPRVVVFHLAQPDTGNKVSKKKYHSSLVGGFNPFEKY